MSSGASASARPNPTGIDEARAAKLRAANINPRTGLATDYLNHFNEAIMLLEMIPDMPECAEDFLLWCPLTYAEHFTASNFRARDLAIEAYEQAHPAVRGEMSTATGPLYAIRSRWEGGQIVSGGVRIHVRTPIAAESGRWSGTMRPAVRNG